MFSFLGRLTPETLVRRCCALTPQPSYAWKTAGHGELFNLRRRPPITVSQPDSPYAHTFRAVATRVWEKVSGKTPARWAGPRIVVE